jgi:DNA polymerase III subunit chi
MTEVAFHFNAADKLGYLCRLLRKASARGSRVAVTGDHALLQQLDRDLWTFSAVDFVAHCDAAADAGQVAASAVVFCDTLDAAPHHEVALNLGVGVATGFERFERLIEVVGTDDADRAQSRLRWKYYLDRGYSITRHDIALKDVA